MDNNEERTCKECSKEFDTAEQVRRHVRSHGTTYQKYVLKWKYDGISPKCRCGCGEETSWNVQLKDFAEHVLGHHAWGRKKSDDEKRRIGEKNSINMKRYLKENPDIAKQRIDHARSLITPESEARRIETLHNTYASMSEQQKKEFSDHGKALWQSGIMDAARVKAAETFKQRNINGEYDFTQRNENLSKSISQKYLDGGFEWSKGKYTSTKTNKECYYRSSWELTYMQSLDSDVDVVSWESEFVRIPYKLDDNNRFYVPDFHVVKIDGSNLLVEIKPHDLRNHPMNIAKRIAAIAYCKAMGWTYAQWSPAFGLEITT